MLRYRLLPLGIIISIAFTACVLAQESGLTNTTFLPDAAGTGPADWKFVDFGTGGKPAYEPRGGQDGSGAVGVIIESAEQRGAWQQRLQLDGMTALHVSGVYRTERVIGSGAMLRLTWLRGEAGWDFVSDVRLPLQASEDWASFEEVFVAPPEAEAVAPEIFNFFGIGTVWWDRIEIREASPQEVSRMARSSAAPGSSPCLRTRWSSRCLGWMTSCARSRRSTRARTTASTNSRSFGAE